MHDILAFLQNHLLLSVTLAVALVLLIIVESIKQRRAGAQLSPQQLTQLINHDNAAVIDVRPADAFATGHIIDAISMTTAELSDKPKKLEKFKSRPIVLVCTTGLESNKSATLLKSKGFNAYSLAGGIRTWREAEMPLIKE